MVKSIICKNYCYDKLYSSWENYLLMSCCLLNIVFFSLVMKVTERRQELLLCLLIFCIKMHWYQYISVWWLFWGPANKVKVPWLNNLAIFNVKVFASMLRFLLQLVWYDLLVIDQLYFFLLSWISKYQFDDLLRPCPLGHGPVTKKIRNVQYLSFLLVNKTFYEVTLLFVHFVDFVHTLQFRSWSRV